MTMVLPLRCRYWTILQMVAIVACYRGKVSSGKYEMVQGCVGSQLSLRCEKMKVINITAVVLGDYNFPRIGCIIRDNDCTRNANANHTMDVHRKCFGQSNCTVDVHQEEIKCGIISPSISDFERITYDCRDDPRNDTMNSTDKGTIVDNRNPDSQSADKSHEEPTMHQDNSHYSTSTAGRLTNLYNNTEAGNQSDPGPATHKPNSERAQGCIGSQLSLRCPEMKVIQISTVVLGDSDCSGASCCIKDNDCTYNANASHRTDVQRRCDNKQSCFVDVFKERIRCGTLDSWSNNDFERITYICIDDIRIASRPDAAETNTYTPENERTNESLTAVMVIICLIILLATVVVVVVMYRRKKSTQMKLSEPVAMTEVDNRQNEADINANETLGTGLHIYSVPLSMTLADEADFPKAEEDTVVYTEVELRETAGKEGQSDRVTTDKTNASIEAHTTGPDGVKDLVNNGDCFQDHIYSLTSHDMADVYANEPLVEIPTRLLEEAVSKTPWPEDDGGLTVIENDLYSH